MSFIYHASVRLCSRYPDSGVTVPDLKIAYETGDYLERVRTSPTRWKFYVSTSKYTIVAVYDTEVRHVITVLPPETMDQDCGRNLLPPHLSKAQMAYLDRVCN